MDNKFSNRTTNHTGDVHFEIVSVVLGHRAAAGPLALGVPGGHRGRLPSAGVLQVRQLRPGVERRGADPPADLSVGDPEDQGLRVKVGRPEGQAGLRAAHLREESSPGAGGLEGDVLPPEISRSAAPERPVPEHNADRHVDAPPPVGRLGGPQGPPRSAASPGAAAGCRPWPARPKPP